MRVDLLLFASLVDVVGARRLRLELPDGATVGDLLARLESEYSVIEKYRPTLLTAVNQEYVESEHLLVDGDEVAIFPPVSGGATAEGERVRRLPGELYRITRAPIDAAGVARELQRDADGAVAVFEGIVRDNFRGRATRYLVYEAYEAMALEKMAEIGARVRDVWEIGTVGIVHRLGRLEIGETSVAVIVTSPHRRAAFDACHYAIDRLKAVVPIWKKEYFEDGEVWVEGER